MGMSRAQGRRHCDDRGAWQVEVEIDQLVLDGFERIDRDAVGSAFGRELDRLLRRHAGALAAGGADGIELASRVARLPGTQLPAGLSPRRLGQSLAGAVFSAIAGAATTPDPRGIAPRPDGAGTVPR
jgi:hypothetical protein